MNILIWFASGGRAYEFRFYLITLLGSQGTRGPYKKKEISFLRYTGDGDRRHYEFVVDRKKKSKRGTCWYAETLLKSNSYTSSPPSDEHIMCMYKIVLNLQFKA